MASENSYILGRSQVSVEMVLQCPCLLGAAVSLSVGCCSVFVCWVLQCFCLLGAAVSLSVGCCSVFVCWVLQYARGTEWMSRLTVFVVLVVAFM